MKLLYITLFLFINAIFGQTIHMLPFASKGNLLEINIENEFNQKFENFEVKIDSKPEWLKFKVINYKIKEILEVPVFEFDVSKDAPVGEESLINIVVTNSLGKIWSKNISVEVGLPENYELNQNYPNPFNPSTTISYVLADDSEVSLKIYDLLGREVEHIINQQQSPGFHKVIWNASHHSSGVYFYILNVKAPMGERFITRKKMMLIK